MFTTLVNALRSNSGLTEDIPRAFYRSMQTFDNALESLLSRRMAWRYDVCMLYRLGPQLTKSYLSHLHVGNFSKEIDQGIEGSIMFHDVVTCADI
ncbi:hypothetical protein BPAE_0077g00320 [Botrytis paeoniae]|uniref:Uncharacterized protein n=1 Tax=Botrytis paeoniae TaxID=278948 RepID=A0A4Z1FL86_9HELO|nr:hypothetical protein BPAE_0077g00320 [Botrytis paeoniae]